VKDRIDAKIKAHGVKTYPLTVVDSAAVKDQKVVGRCEGRAKKIVYKKGQEAPISMGRDSRRPDRRQ